MYLSTTTIDVYERHIPCTAQFRFHRSRLRLTEAFFGCVICGRLISGTIITFFRFSNEREINFRETFASIGHGWLHFMFFIDDDEISMRLNEVT